MPYYRFECQECEEIYEKMSSFDKTGNYPKVTCPSCDSSDKKLKLNWAGGFNFSDPVGTDRWNNSHDYRYKHKMPSVREERKKAEDSSHMGKTPYSSKS